MRTAYMTIRDTRARLLALLITTVVAAALILSFGCGAGANLPVSSTETGTEAEAETFTLGGGSFSSSFAVDPRGWLRFDFSTAVDQASALENISAASGPQANLAKATGDPLDTETRFRNDNTTVLVKAPRLPYCYPITVTIAAGLAAENGLTLDETYIFDFTTMADPRDIDGDCKADLVGGSIFHNFDDAQYDPIGGLLGGMMPSINKGVGPPPPPPGPKPPADGIGVGPGIAYVFPGTDLAGEGQALFDLDAPHDYWKFEDPTYALMGIGLGKPLGDMSGDGRAEFSVSAFDPVSGIPQAVIFCDTDDAEPDATIPAALTASPVGDVNGDGLADVVVSGMDQAGGQEYSLHLGKDQCISATPDAVLALDTAAIGLFVTGIKNFNGDISEEGRPLQDFAIGTIGAVHVFLGSADVAQVAVPDVTISSADFDLFGISLSGGGDVNGDGFDDLIVGAPAGLGPIVVELLEGGDLGGLFGPSISSPMGASPLANLALKFMQPGPAPGDEYAGRAYLFYGSADPQMSSKADADVVFTGDMQQLEGLGYIFGDILALMGLTEIPGVPDMFGSSVYIGEVNGDTNADVIIGAPFAVQLNPEATNLVELGGGIVEALMEYMVDGDDMKLMEFLVVEIFTMMDGIGAAYVFEGMDDMPADVAYYNADAAYKAQGEYLLGTFIRHAGDVNGDGIDDFYLTDATLEIEVVLFFGIPFFKLHVDLRSGLFLGGDDVSGFDKDIDDAKAVLSTSIPEGNTAILALIPMLLLSMFLP